MKDELSYKGNPIDKKIEEILGSWGSRQSSRRGFIAKASKVTLGTIAGMTFGLGLPMGRSLLRTAEAACDCDTLGPFCGASGRLCCGCDGGEGSCPSGTSYDSAHYWEACCSGTKYRYFDCCTSGNFTCGGPNCSNPTGGHGVHCPSDKPDFYCVIAVSQGAC